mmetsp:Transcript_4914/g.17843  ORF Transcript_4914/g.17843 Transcript_4914/m.17843 type:complete len:96 (+) Transcript_4914:646-933(+)
MMGHYSRWSARVSAMWRPPPTKKPTKKAASYMARNSNGAFGNAPTTCKNPGKHKATPQSQLMNALGLNPRWYQYCDLALSVNKSSMSSRWRRRMK